MTSGQIKLTVALGSALIGALLTWLILTFAMPEKAETVLLRTSNEFNRNCPVMLDKATRFDNTAVAGKSIRFCYTLINTVKDSVDTTLFKSITEPFIKQRVKENSALQYLKTAKVTLVYIYRDKNGNRLTEITVEPTEK
jgi:hypothetical protein